MKSSLISGISLGICGLLITSMASAALPPPQPTYADVNVSNNTSTVLTVITDKNPGTIIVKAPNPIIPGLSTYIDQGNTYNPAGMTLAIGSFAHLAGLCIIKVGNGDITITQPGDGSDGITCHLSSNKTVIVTSVNK